MLHVIYSKGEKNKTKTSAQNIRLFGKQDICVIAHRIVFSSSARYKRIPTDL
jgi:hypothetical protein